MRHAEPIVGDRSTVVQYHQFTMGPGLRGAMRVVGMLTWPVIVPLALASRRSDFVFRTASEALALAPYLFGIILRAEFYRWSLRRCGRNLNVGFGTVFLYRDIEIGDHVLIGSYNTVHHCDFGSYVLVADGCRLLSGSRYHHFDRTDVPMALQGGRLRRIRLGDDCWIGSDAVVMSDVGTGAVVGAGSVVSRPVEPYTVVAGNPARLVRRRK